MDWKTKRYISHKLNVLSSRNSGYPLNNPIQSHRDPPDPLPVLSAPSLLPAPSCLFRPQCAFPFPPGPPRPGPVRLHAPSYHSSRHCPQPYTMVAGWSNTTECRRPPSFIIARYSRSAPSIAIIPTDVCCGGTTPTLHTNSVRRVVHAYPQTHPPNDRATPTQEAPSSKA